MEVINIHKRVISQPKGNISTLFGTLATKNDEILAINKWPPMVFKEGLKVGSKGGHGPIRYTIHKFIPGDFIEFNFTKPKGFNGSHRFEITELESNKTEIKHTIEMNTSSTAILTWPIAIRWLHDAFIEDSFDKVENHFLNKKKNTKWSIWVKILRSILKPKKAQNKANLHGKT